MAGFGDFSPVTPAGRVFFIPFVLLAVPIVTSFAVQTITGLVSHLNRHIAWRWLMGS
jgi:potassium channel subfamily K